MLNKYSKYKEIIIVDTENVGYECVSGIMDNQYIVFFVRSISMRCKKRCWNQMHNVEVIDVNEAQEAGVDIGKNALDFCIVSQVAYLCTKVSKKCKITILSKDHGYDIAIYHMQKLYKHLNIQRVAMGVEDYLVNKENLPKKQKCVIEMDFENEDVRKIYDEFMKYKSTLKPSEKKLLQVEKYHNSIHKVTMIEKDPIHNCYFLLYGGRYIAIGLSTDDLRDLFEEYKKLS